MIEAGRVLQNRYRVEKQIGQGGMGAVYVATDERFGSTVAIKETLFMDEKFRKAFEREARLLNSLRHPALPRVSDHFIEGNGQFLVMEFIDGEDLAERLEHEGEVFTVDDVMTWADQLLDALEYLHAQEMPVIHRDIKPQNLKLTSRGQIILLDFGLAKGNTTNAESATAAKSVFGYSRNYASLEQIQGTGTDPRSDLYSLAATLYHLMTGVPPADALTRAMVVLSDKDDPLIAANRIRREIPAGVARVLQRAMALNAEQRPASAREMRALLAAVRDEKPSDETETVLGAPAEADFFTQKTQLQAGAAALSNLKQSEMKTAVLPAAETRKTNLETGDFPEEETRVRSLAATAADEAARPKRRGAALGAALASLLLLAGVAAGLYVYKPAVFGAAEETRDAPEENPKRSVVLVPVEDPLSAASNANAANANAAPANANTSAAPSEPAKETVAKTETRPTANKTPDAPKAPNKPPRTEITVIAPENADEEDAAATGRPSDVKVPKPPTNPRTGQPFPFFVWRQMTPEQRRQLKEALEIDRLRMEQERRRRQTVPPPAPSPRP